LRGEPYENDIPHGKIVYHMKVLITYVQVDKRYPDFSAYKE